MRGLSGGLKKIKPRFFDCPCWLAMQFLFSALFLRLRAIFLASSLASLESFLQVSLFSCLIVGVFCFGFFLIYCFDMCLF